MIDLLLVPEAACDNLDWDYSQLVKSFCAILVLI